MQDDCISVALGLTHLMVLAQLEIEGHFEVTVRYWQDKLSCPSYGGKMVKKHESVFQRKKDRKLRDRVVVLTLEKRRFCCLSCSKVFTGLDESSVLGGA